MGRVALLVMLLALVGLAQEPGQRASRLRALLVGIDRVPTGPRPRKHGEPAPLQWAEADARAMGRLLETGFGTRAEDVLELPGALASRAALLSALRRHFEPLGAGDTGLFFFSGHGTSVPGEPGGEESGGYVEALVTADPPGPAGETVVLLDQEVHALFLDALAGKGVHAVIVLDCCYSGGLFRSEFGPAKGFGPSRGWAGEGTTPLPPGAVGLFACGPGQQAREWEGNGLFTGALLSELAIASGSPTTYRELVARVRARMERMPPGKFQKPGARGEEHHPLFARSLPGARPRAVLLETASGEGWIDRGAADSTWFHPGRLLAVYALDPARYTANRLGTAEVLQCLGLKSAVLVRSGRLEVGGFVEPLGGPAEAPWIRVRASDLPDSLKREVLAGLEESGEFRLVAADQEADVVLSVKDGAVYALDGITGLPLDAHRGGPDWRDVAPRSWRELLPAMALWRRWAALQGLQPNPSLEIRLFRSRGATRELLEPDAMGRYRARVGDLLDLEASLAERTSGPWHLYPFFLSEGYEYGLLDPLRTDRRLWVRPRRIEGIQVSRPPGWDRLLLFTSRSSGMEGRFPDSLGAWRSGTSQPFTDRAPLHMDGLLLQVIAEQP